MGQRGVHRYSQGGPLPQVVSLEVVALGPLHWSVMCPGSDPHSFRAGWMLRITEWGPGLLGGI